MKIPLIAALFLALPGPLFAGNYFQQADFSVPFSSIAGVDTDAVGNLYVLGLPPGATTYQVRGYRPHNLDPLFSFDTGLSFPAAFAVEGSGTVDILDHASGFLLRRFSNTGTFLSDASFGINANYTYFSSAIDKAGGRVYLAYRHTVSYFYMQCVGCSQGPSQRTLGTVARFDMQGNSLASIPLPGDSLTAGSCYTPSQIAADPQGGVFVADGDCGQVLKLSESGDQVLAVPASRWGGYFSPRMLWTDASSNLYVGQSVCTGLGCPVSIIKLGPDGTPLAVFAADFSAAGAWDSRILYLGSTGERPLKRYIYNGAPSVPAETGPLAAWVQHSSAAAFAWQASGDSDGDPIMYTVRMGTSPSSMALAGASDQAGLSSEPLVFGVTYYWQVLAQDSYLGLSLQTATAPVVGFNLNFRNSVPGAFSVLKGTGSASTRESSVLLAWQASADQDEDPLVYELAWRAAGESTSTVIARTQTPAYSVSGLSFGTTYYWSVRVQDPYGALRAMSGPAEQSYFHAFRNSAPEPAVYLSTAAAAYLHDSAPALSLEWSNSLDPDDDPVSYVLDVRTATRTWPGAVLSETRFSQPVLFETTYYWRVTAMDAYGGASTGPWLSWIAHLRNQPPRPVKYLAPASVSTRAAAYPLDWQDSGDPDNDPVEYRLDVGISSSALSEVYRGSIPRYDLPLQYGTTLYWRVLSVDSFGAATEGETRSLYAAFLNEPPQAAKLKGISPLIQTMRNQVQVSWEPVSTPQNDPITYTVYLGGSPQDMSVVAKVLQNSDGRSIASASANARVDSDEATNEVRLTLSQLDFYHTYYVRVVAENPYGAASASTVQSFSLSSASGFPKAYNYPNPFSPSRGGTNIVFNAPSSGYSRAKISVYSETQELLFDREYSAIPPGVSQIRLDGRDRYGRALYNGSYICRVRFEDPDEEQVFYLLVVK
ncbi:MAG: hypothetical protein WCU88_09810 [Elusimicrobiota bacterium]|jgi:hypothetical protein